jgi:hypothetical protein
MANPAAHPRPHAIAPHPTTTCPRAAPADGARKSE